MKRSSISPTQKMRLISHQSSASPAVTLFKLEDTDNDPEPGAIMASSSRPSKRVKAEVTKTDETAYGDGDGAESPALSSKVPTGKGKGKKRAASQRPPARTASSRSASAGAALPQKPKAIKQALEKPHPAPARWRETYDAIKEMRTRFPAPVDTMGCDTAKWKETDPRVRHAMLCVYPSGFSKRSANAHCLVLPLLL
jgi:endonuclease-3